MQIKVPYSPGKASAAIARTAYLAAFYRFGYRYILSEPVELLRSEIQLATEVHSARLCLLIGTSRFHSVPTGNAPESVIVPVVLEEGYRFFLAMMKFRHNRDYWMFCALPRAEQPPESMFVDLSRAVQVLGSMDINITGDETGEISVQFVMRDGCESR